MDEAEKKPAEFQFTPVLHSRFDLYKTVRKFYVKPSTYSPGEALVIDRYTEDIALEYLNTMPTPSTRTPIVGVMGIVKMIPCKYLVVIEEKTRVSPETSPKPHILSNTWRVEKVNMLPVAPERTPMSNKKSQLNDYYELTMLEIFNSKTFYFSYDIDLSQSLKSISEMDPNATNYPGIFFRCKKIYIWNLPILIPFLKLKTAFRYVIPVVNGFVRTSIVNFKNSSVYLSLISRRRRPRSGKRYFCRGINGKGFCANFVESELIVETGKTITAFILTRGSHPFYWMQWPDLSFTPKPHILYRETNDFAFGKHVKDLIKEYGSIYIIDIVNEFRRPNDYKNFHNFLNACVLESAFANYLKLLSIDLFKLNWSTESIHDFEVYRALRQILSTAIIKKTIKQRQIGVFHICSLDGTDMTDILQFSLAKTALLDVLMHAESNPEVQRQLHSALLPVLSQLWLENSNSLALDYVGTKSLGSEFYSTNILERKRTITDLRILLQRWWINNFKDGIAQDCIDILISNSPDKGIPENVEYGYQRAMVETLSNFLLSVVLPFGVVFSIAHLLLLAQNDMSLRCSIQWGAVALFTTFLIFKNLHCMLNIPKLTPKPDIKRHPFDWYFYEQ